MASSYLEVGSKGLTELKNDLTNLSKALHELFELMNTDMRQVGDAWRDGKYEEFVSGYRPKINKCEEISERYAEWCKKVLEPAIEECIDIETTDVDGDGGGAGGAGKNESGGTGATGSDRSQRLTAAEKAARFSRATESLQNRIANATPGPQGSGFSTPQNERPRLSSQQLSSLLNGRQR